jgi:predicted AlkP superfamily phosphohydrolase/phosphomutase
LDGASPHLIERWIDELPNLKKIMKNGVSGTLKSTTPPATCPAWNCFMTGKNPGKIGIYDFIKPFDLESGPKVVDYSIQEDKAVWEILGDHEKKVCVINVPMTHPPRKVNGLMVSGMISTTKLGVYTYPETLAKELDRVVDGYEISPDVVCPSQMKGAEKGFIREIDRITKKRLRAAKHLMNNYEWDFFMVVFVSLDLVQHFFWSYMDKSHPNHDPNTPEEYQNIIKDSYKKLDTAIGELTEELDENTVVSVMSDHGFGPLHGYFLTNSWLEKEGFLKKGSGEGDYKNFLVSHNLTGKRLKTLLLKIGVFSSFKKIKNKLPTWLHDLIPLEDNPLIRDIDWSATKAYGSGNFGLIYINREGRESKGVVKEGNEYKEVRSTIIDGLRGLKHPKTGKRIVTKVYRAEEIYRGEHLDKAPDLVIILDEGRYNQGEWFIKDKTWLTPDQSSQKITGAHRTEGVWMMRGPNVKGNLKLDAEIIDLAPTFLHLFNQAVPGDMDGKVLKDALVSSADIKYEEASKKEKIDYEYSEEEEELIKERLRNLGYIG